MSSATVAADGDLSSGIAPQLRRDPQERAVEKGKGKGFEVKFAGKGGAHAPCHHCDKIGQPATSCWILHPDQLPWKRQAASQEYYEEGETYRDIGQLEVLDPDGHDERKIQKRKAGRGKTKKDQLV